MAEISKIEWTDATFNPWWGCTKVSPACDNCYAEALDRRVGGDHWGAKAPRRRTSEHNWNEPRRWNKKAAKFYEANKRRRRVFCASMADVFDNQIDPGWRIDLWSLIRECDHLDWLLLTKRPQNIKKMLPEDWGSGWMHVWLGATVENPDETRRISHLRNATSGTTFLSMEPLLDDVNITPWLSEIDWVITGGESGPGSRNANPDWYRSIRDQCIHAGVPFHFKQWGDWDETGKRIGKKKAGRILDGRTWDEVPVSRAA